MPVMTSAHHQRKRGGYCDFTLQISKLRPPKAGVPAAPTTPGAPVSALCLGLTPGIPPWKPETESPCGWLNISPQGRPVLIPSLSLLTRGRDSAAAAIKVRTLGGGDLGLSGGQCHHKVLIRGKQEGQVTGKA